MPVPTQTNPRSYLIEPKPLTINLLTNYMDELYWFLIFVPLTRAARQVVFQTPSELLGLTRLPSCRQFTCVSPLAATLMDASASAANKRLMVGLTPLYAALTKNTGVGVFRPLSTAMPPLLFHTLANCNFGNTFILIFIQNGGAVGGSLLRSLTLSPLAAFNFQLSTFNFLLLATLPTGRGPRDTGHSS